MMGDVAQALSLMQLAARQFGLGRTGANPMHPASTGALLGMNYQGMPDARHVEDQRQMDLTAALMANTAGGGFVLDYPPTDLGGSQTHTDAPGWDPMLGAAPQMEASLPAGMDPDTYKDQPYPRSYRPHWKPHPTDAPYRRFETGPNPPPPKWVHLPISPGDPGWTTPPSESGPHNRQGDPPRPGYARDVFETD